MKPRAAVLFMTHVWDRLMRLKFERLRSEIGDLAQVYVLIQKSDQIEHLRGENHDIVRSAIMFDVDALPAQLGYPYQFLNSLVPGSAHFPLLAFFKAAKACDHCFLIEHDVEFSGNWRDLIAETLDARPDFASLHFFSFEDRPDWEWWATTEPGEADRAWASDQRNLRRSFNPVYCLSRRAADLIDAAHRAGWRAHNEILLATICSHHGCKIVDLQELGGFCVGYEQNHRPGMDVADVATVRWRPWVSIKEFFERSTGRTLFHPVKGQWFFDGSRVVSLAPPPGSSRSNVMFPGRD
jgi:hypothetical protein